MQVMTTMKCRKSEFDFMMEGCPGDFLWGGLLFLNGTLLSACLRGLTFQIDNRGRKLSSSPSVSDKQEVHYGTTKIIDEINYFKAQSITDLLYQQNLISFVEYDKLTELNRQTFSPLFADLFPKTLEKSSV